IEMLQADPEGERFLRDPGCSGGSCIVGPDTRILAGPMGAEEAIIYADCDLDLGIRMKLRHDFAGHYNRPDIFHLQINRAAPKLYSVHGVEQAAPVTRLAASPGTLLPSPDAGKGDSDGSYRARSDLLPSSLLLWHDAVADKT